MASDLRASDLSWDDVAQNGGEAVLLDVYMDKLRYKVCSGYSTVLALSLRC